LRYARLGYIPPHMPLELKDIEARKKEIAKSMSAMQRELEDLEAATRVLLLFQGHQQETGVKLRVLPAPGTSKRPEGVPTTFDMTESVLEDAEKSGKDGLTAKELVEAIRDKYWPGLKSQQVLPIIYGFVPDRLHKTSGGKFKRKKA
jgi:hypothetical protein